MYIHQLHVLQFGTPSCGAVLDWYFIKALSWLFSDAFHKLCMPEHATGYKSFRSAFSPFFETCFDDALRMSRYTFKKDLQRSLM